MQRKGSAVALKTANNPGSELNLAPIMSVLVILIPIILLTFNFFEVRVQAVLAPKMTPGEKRPAEKPLRATLFVEHDFIRITASSLDAPIEVPMKEDGTHDYATAAKHMKALKAAHPRATKVYVGAAPAVRWQPLAVAMDVVRVPTPGPDGKVGKNAPPLFEQVILVTE